MLGPSVTGVEALNVIETGSHGSESFSGQGAQASGLRPVDSGQWTLWPVDSVASGLWPGDQASGLWQMD